MNFSNEYDFDNQYAEFHGRQFTGRGYLSSSFFYSHFLCLSVCLSQKKHIQIAALSVLICVIILQKQGEEGIHLEVVIMHLVREVQLLPHQGQILIVPGMVPLIEAVGCMFLLGGNHIRQRDAWTDLLGGIMMTLIFMMIIHME